MIFGKKIGECKHQGVLGKDATDKIYCECLFSSAHLRLCAKHLCAVEIQLLLDETLTVGVECGFLIHSIGEPAGRYHGEDGDGVYYVAYSARSAGV